MFEYQGYHFKGIGKIPEIEKKYQRYLKKCRPSNVLCFSNIGEDKPYKHPWNYNSFYKANGGFWGAAEVFINIETGRLFLPSSFEMWEYTGDYTPIRQEEA